MRGERDVVRRRTCLTEVVHASKPACRRKVSGPFLPSPFAREGIDDPASSRFSSPALRVPPISTCHPAQFPSHSLPILASALPESSFACYPGNRRMRVLPTVLLLSPYKRQDTHRP